MSRRWKHDVWSHKQLLDVVSHTPVETRLLGEVQAAFDWTDVTRAFHSAGRENLFLVELSRRRTGKPRIAAAGWIMSGSAPASKTR